ncbi:MAG: CPBP family intramembrane glutamic endopeptidase [Planctomycetota bacterium]|nr:CPBP family intramembrane glutamic endopeptidase [Planctomycetota bacterium]
MISSRVGGIVVFLSTLMATGTVIASPTTLNQEPPGLVLQPAVDWITLWPIPVAIVAIIIFFCLPDTWLRRPRLKQWRWSPNMGLILFAIALLSGLMGSAIALALLGPSASEINELDIRSMLFLMLGNYVGEVVIILLVPGLVLGLIKARKDPVDSEQVPVTWWQALLSGIGGLVISWPVVISVGALVGMLITVMTGVTLPDISHGTLNQLNQAAATPDGWFISIIILIVVVTPIIEEVLYRGLLQESIRRHPLLSNESPWFAIIITSILFALMHGAIVDLRGVFALFVLSLGFGWVYLKTGRLLACIVMHAGFNALNLLQVLV